MPDIVAILTAASVLLGAIFGAYASIITMISKARETARLELDAAIREQNRHRYDQANTFTIFVNQLDEKLTERINRVEDELRGRRGGMGDE